MRVSFERKLCDNENLEIKAGMYGAQDESALPIVDLGFCWSCFFNLSTIGLNGQDLIQPHDIVCNKI